MGADDTLPPSDPPRETERDEAAALRDGAAAERDQAGDHRDGSAYDRDAAAAERDVAAAQRDLESDQRDVTAAQRDELAVKRDLVVSGDGRAGPVTNILIVRAALARRDSAADRRRAAADRDAGESGRIAAEQDRDAASTLRLEAEFDRDAASSERTEAAFNRAAARLDRTAAAAESDAPPFDELTGTYRRAAGFIELDREMARSRRMDQPLTLVAVDVVDRETVNETRGRSAGDEVLVDVADTISSIFRPYDVVIRAAEDEFVCAISGLGMEDATKRLAQVAPTLAALPGQTSVAAGFAELRPGDSREDVVARAETALQPVQ